MEFAVKMQARTKAFAVEITVIADAADAADAEFT